MVIQLFNHCAYINNCMSWLLSDVPLTVWICWMSTHCGFLYLTSKQAVGWIELRSFFSSFSSPSSLHNSSDTIRMRSFTSNLFSMYALVFQIKYCQEWQWHKWKRKSSHWKRLHNWKLGNIKPQAATAWMKPANAKRIELPNKSWWLMELPRTAEKRKCMGGRDPLHSPSGVGGPGKQSFNSDPTCEISGLGPINQSGHFNNQLSCQTHPGHQK